MDGRYRHYQCRKEGLILCARGQLPFFLFLSLLLLLSRASSQDGGSPLPLPDWSELSELSSQDEGQIELPAMPTPQIDPRLPLEKRQALMLKAWIAWSKEVETSWNKAKSSYEKADNARVKQIESRDIEIAALKDQLRQAQAAAWIAGLGGAITGFIVDRIVSR